MVVFPFSWICSTSCRIPLQTCWVIGYHVAKRKSNSHHKSHLQIRSVDLIKLKKYIFSRWVCFVWSHVWACRWSISNIFYLLNYSCSGTHSGVSITCLCVYMSLLSHKDCGNRDAFACFWFCRLRIKMYSRFTKKTQSSVWFFFSLEGTSFLRILFNLLMLWIMWYWFIKRWSILFWKSKTSTAFSQWSVLLMSRSKSNLLSLSHHVIL